MQGEGPEQGMVLLLGRVPFWPHNSLGINPLPSETDKDSYYP
jgi:hypothetical protein